MLVVPFVDLATNVWPIRIGDLAWRYGASGLLSGFLLTPLLALCIGIAAAAAFAHRRALKVFGILSALGAAALCGIMILFALDVIQYRAQVPPEARPNFQIGAIRAWGKHLAIAAALAWLAVGALRTARSSS